MPRDPVAEPEYEGIVRKILTRTYVKIVGIGRPTFGTGLAERGSVAGLFARMRANVGPIRLTQGRSMSNNTASGGPNGRICLIG